VSVQIADTVYGYATERLWMTSMCPIRIANPQRFRRGSDNCIQWVTFMYVYAIWIRGGFGTLYREIKNTVSLITTKIVNTKYFVKELFKKNNFFNLKVSDKDWCRVRFTKPHVFQSFILVGIVVTMWL
jgi:hypothetical protein